METSTPKEKRTLKITSETFRNACQICQLLEGLLEHAKIEFTTVKRADIWFLNLPDLNIEFVPAHHLKYIKNNYTLNLESQTKMEEEIKRKNL